MSGNDFSVFFIGGGKFESSDVFPERVGFKAYNLMRMDRVGLPVPPAFVLGTEFCRDFFDNGCRLPEKFDELLAANIRRLENACNRTFGGRRRPLLVSVRSGAPVSMPGMLDSVLNVGLNDATAQGIIRMTGNPRLAWDSYRRFVELYASVVYGHRPRDYARLPRAYLQAPLFSTVNELDATSMRDLAMDNLEMVRAKEGRPFPQDPMQQLTEAVAAVFRSWQSPRAVEYRRLNGIDGDSGTAVTVQTMVFGNAGGTSGSGVGFTRDPATGENEIYLDFLFNAQGEDVVSGRRAVTDATGLADLLPNVFAKLKRVKSQLESEFKDLQDFEFTVQEGELYLLQTRAGKRTPWSALHIAVDMVNEGLIDPETALARLDALDLDAIQRVKLDLGDSSAALARATPASIGVATGKIALDSETAQKAARRGDPVILVRDDMSTEDIGGLAVAEGMLTVNGGRTSHAAVVARQMGKVCLVGCAGLRIDNARRRCVLGGKECREGDFLSLDGNSGQVYAGRVDIEYERPEVALGQVNAWRRTAAVN